MTGWRPRHPPGASDPVAAFPAPIVPAFARRWRRLGCTFVDAEPAYPRLPAAEAARYGYGLGSFRTGAATTAESARAWLEAAAGIAPLPPPEERDGRVVDPARPDLEPGGFASLAEADALRRVTFAAIRRAARAHTLVLPLADGAAGDLPAVAGALARLGAARLLLVPLADVPHPPLEAAAAGLGEAVDLAPALSGEVLADHLAGATMDESPDDAALDALAPRP